MPRSDNEPGSPPEPEVAGQTLAVTAEALYLANLLVAPGLAFFILLALYFRRSEKTPPLADCHLRQTVRASIWGGILLVVANLLIILLGGYTAPTTWTIVILYFTTCHSTLVLLGVVGLAKAMAGRNYIYPLVGRPC